MPNFRSLGQSLHIDNFCKNDGGGGEGGPPIILTQKKPDLVFRIGQGFYNKILKNITKLGKRLTIIS